MNKKDFNIDHANSEINDRGNDDDKFMFFKF